MEVQPIKTEADYQAALATIERLFNAPSGSTEADKLDILTTLVEVYEERHHPIPPPDPIEALIYHMEAHNLSRPDLEPAIGSRARVSEVLNRKRPLTIRMIRGLHSRFGISADMLIRPYPLVSTTKTAGKTTPAPTRKQAKSTKK